MRRRFLVPAMTQIPLSTLTTYADPGSRFTCPLVGVPWNGSTLVVPRRLLQAALSAPSICKAYTDDASLYLQGPRARYRLALWTELWKIRREVNQWAEARRKAELRRRSPAFAAQGKASRQAKLRAKWWAEDHGYRGVGTAASKLDEKVRWAAWAYRGAMNAYRKGVDKQNADELTPYYTPPTPSDWLAARQRAKQAGHWLSARCGGFDWTRDRNELASLLGAGEFPPESGLSTSEKRMPSGFAVAIDKVRSYTDARKLSTPLSPWRERRPAERALEAYRSWQAAIQQRAEFLAVLNGEIEYSPKEERENGGTDK